MSYQLVEKKEQSSACREVEKPWRMWRNSGSRMVAKEGWGWTKGEDGGLRQSGYAVMGRRACALEGYS